MTLTTTTPAIKWSIDKVNSQVGFSVKYLLFSTVRGSFKEFDGDVYTESENFETAEIEFRINAASIETGVAQRDAHLKNADFFDVEKFNQIKFKSTKFLKSGKPGNYELEGELTIKEITKQISLHVESGGIIKDPWGTEKAQFSVTGKIDRKDWELNWNAVLETGGFLVSDEVGISCEILLTMEA